MGWTVAEVEGEFLKRGISPKKRHVDFWKWEGWQDEKSKETIKALAKLTKGYGGADLRVRVHLSLGKPSRSRPFTSLPFYFRPFALKQHSML